MFNDGEFNIKEFNSVVEEAAGGLTILDFERAEMRGVMRGIGRGIA